MSAGLHHTLNRLPPPQPLPRAVDCPQRSFWDGWWNGMGIGAISTAALATIVWKAFA